MTMNSARPTKAKTGTLGLTGITIKAMALIAPGAFLWATFQMQAAVPGIEGQLGQDIWPGVVLALVCALLTALAYAQLAGRFPEAGHGGAYYFAEKALLDRRAPVRPFLVRTSKFVTGWAAHLFYWIYPGVMIAFLTTLVAYVLSAFGPAYRISAPTQIALAWIFSAAVGYLAVRGISGSTLVSLVLNVVQLGALLTFGALALGFRQANPAGLTADAWASPSVLSVLAPARLGAVMQQAAIAIVIYVGFEASTSLAAQARNPRRDIPRAAVLALLIQAVVAYLFQYFAASYAMGDWLRSADGTLRGMGAASVSRAPIGDMAIAIGDALLGGFGFALMVLLALTVAISLLATALASMNTGVRISYAMAQDEEMPEALGLLHGEFATPYVGIFFLVLVSGIIGSIGSVGGLSALAGVTLASNLGTLTLYGLVSLLTFVAFFGEDGFSPLKHGLVPLLALALNAALVVGLIIRCLSVGGMWQGAILVALGISGTWLLVSVLYVRRRRG